MEILADLFIRQETMEKRINLLKSWVSSHPKALFVLVAVQMLECFSYYGMRALLILFMFEQLKYSDSKSFTIYALFTGLVELGGIVGGMIADSVLGKRKTILIGAFLIVFGHIGLAVTPLGLGFSLSLSLIVMGSALFGENVAAFLGQMYPIKSAQKEEGFTLYYVGCNIGAIVATILCGYVAKRLGWYLGFGLASIGMLFGVFTLLFFGRSLKEQEQLPKNVSRARKSLLFSLLPVYMIVFAILMVKAEIILPYVPIVAATAFWLILHKLLKAKKISKKCLTVLMTTLAAGTLFFAVEEQICSSLLLFSERLMRKDIFGFQMPVTSLLCINPVVIILFGFYSSRFASGKKRLVFPFFIAAASFAFLGILLAFGKEILAFPVALTYFLISFAEALIGPSIYSTLSECADHSSQGKVMALLPAVYSLASFIGGWISKFMAVEEGRNLNDAADIYQRGFFMVAILAVAIAALLALIKVKQEKIA